MSGGQNRFKIKESKERLIKNHVINHIVIATYKWMQQLPTYGGPTMLEVVVSMLACAGVQMNAATPKKMQ